VTLTDAGALVALLDKRDPEHAACLLAAQSLPSGPMLTTWPCFTEAIYMLGKIGGYYYQERLWALRRSGRLQLLDITVTDADRMDVLMKQYQNVPMDLADASLVAVAESRAVRRLFTIDSDFYIYRLAEGSVLEIVR
jgi:predicted nucleic acid-binding protein